MPAPLTGVCEQCGGPCRTDKRRCSMTCYAAAVWTVRECGSCSKEFRVRKIYAERPRTNYCSVKCMGVGSRKHEVRDFDGDRFYFHKRHGYFESAATKRKMHRAVMEKECRAMLMGFVVVHHRNGNKTDNRPENLQIMGRGEHTTHHNRERWNQAQS